MSGSPNMYLVNMRKPMVSDSLNSLYSGLDGCMLCVAVGPGLPVSGLCHCMVSEYGIYLNVFGCLCGFLDLDFV